MITAARIIGTAGLLFVIWLHTHWSVALALTLMAINNEVEAWLLRAVAEALKETARLLQR